MDSVQPSQSADSSEDMPVEQLCSLDPSDAYNVFGEPEILPRVGDQYQVEIPQLITKSEYLLYAKNPFEVELAPSLPREFLIGLPIPVTWINKEAKSLKHDGKEFGDSIGTSNKNGLLDSESRKATQDCPIDGDSILKVEPLDATLENGVGSEDLTSFTLEQEMKSKIDKKCRGGRCCLVPGFIGSLWSNTEEASFLLGLYIFGKNLVQVKRFIGSKTMGDILSFYYGKFYRSDKYRRWLEGRKLRSRKCVYGQKIFTGMRQQELFSRLFAQVPEECQNTMLEVSKAFGDGKLSLEEYVSTLKAIVGLNSLVEAVAIGEGKKDLTSITLESLKSNHVIPTRSEIPIGKAWSSLTTEEIIKFLTGDVRLSKARSSDLFWEAIWPRLLARGWHSEQPRDWGVYAAGSKHSLVFLIPGVKKFSRWKLVKGTQYFDSVTDVLSKVASDPSILEFDAEADDSNGNKEENGKDDLSDQRHHRYLQPRTPSQSTDLMKLFTVVDTSLAVGTTFKVRELRTLPNQVLKKIHSKSHSEESGMESYEVSSEDSDYIDTMFFGQNKANQLNSKKTVTDVVISDEKDSDIVSLTQGSKMNDKSYGNASVKNSEDLSNFCDHKQPRKPLKTKRKPNGDLNIVPKTKRHQKLSACTQAEMRQGLLGSEGPILGQQKHTYSCCSETTVSSENNKRVSSTSSSKSNSLIESSEGPSHAQPLIDLNATPDLETVEFSAIDLKNEQNDQAENEQDDRADKQPENLAVSRAFSEASCSEIESNGNGNSRRQSTRNRPPTARALEALANGFLTTCTRKRRKNKDNTMSRPSRYAHTEMAVTESFGASTVASQMAQVGNGLYGGNNDMFIQFPALSQGNESQASGP